MTLTEQMPSGALPSIAGTVLSTLFGVASFDTNSTLLLMPGFLLVPSAAVGEGVQQVGTSQASWAEARNGACAKSLGWMFRVAGGPPEDQLGAFRERTLPAEHEAESGFPCPQPPTCLVEARYIRALLQLDASAFRLRKLFGEPRVTNAGLLRGYAGPYLFLDVNNGGADPAAFVVEPLGCCWNYSQNGSQACGRLVEYAQQQSVEAAMTARFRFLLEAAFLEAVAGGWCEFSLSQHGRVELPSIRVPFSPLAFLESPDLLPISDDLPACPAGFHLVRSHGRLYCAAPCTEDEQWREEERRCLPVDCAQRYPDGSRPRFNEATRRCEPRALCAVNEWYDSLENRCLSLYAALLAPEDDPRLAPQDKWEDIGIEYARLQALDCGPNGRPNAQNTSCICTQGWSTRPDQDPLGYAWCLQPDAQPTNRADLVTYRWRLSARGILIILAVAVILLCSCCGCITCCVLLVRCARLALVSLSFSLRTCLSRSLFWTNFTC